MPLKLLIAVHVTSVVVPARKMSLGCDVHISSYGMEESTFGIVQDTEVLATWLGTNTVMFPGTLMMVGGTGSPSV